MSVVVREDCVTHTISLALDVQPAPIYVTVTVKSKDTDAARRLTDRLRKVVMMHWTDSVSGAQCMMNVAQFAELEAWAANEQQHPR